MYHEFFTRATPDTVTTNYLTVMVGGAAVNVVDAYGNKQISPFVKMTPVYTAKVPTSYATYSAFYAAQVSFLSTLLKQF